MRTIKSRLCMLALWLAAAPAANAADLAGTRASIARGLDAQYPRIEALYKDIHAHPELGFQEARTAAKLAGEMRALGYEVTEGVGKTGLVAIYKNGAGPTVMVRTELDALPLPEKTGLPYASTAKQTLRGVETPVMHACGHDIHMAVWVAVAKTMLDLKDQWSGTLMFVAQPAEEGGGGAKSMVADGLFTRFPKPDYGFALHVGPGPFGVVSLQARRRSTRPPTALSITFNGKGGHGSRPHTTIDPVMMAGHFIVDVQSVISREKDAARFGVVTIGSVQAGNAGNVIPDSATLRGTIRSYDNATRLKMLEGIERTAKAVAMMAGAPRARDQDQRRRQGGGQRRCARRPQRRGAEGGVRRQGAADVGARLGQRGLFGVHHGRRAVVLLRHRRPRSQGPGAGGGRTRLRCPATTRPSSPLCPNPPSAPARRR